MSYIKRALEQLSILMGYDGEITFEVMAASDDLRVFVDDLRTPPPGWVHVSTPEKAIEVLQTGLVRVMSFDHDLGLPEPENGYKVLKWIEEQVYTQGFKPPKLWLHTANSGAIAHMLLAIRSIYKQANIPYTFHPVWKADGPESERRVPTGDES